MSATEPTYTPVEAARLCGVSLSKDFEHLSRRYLSLLAASTSLTPGLEAVYYNAINGFTLQFLTILAAVTPDDDVDIGQQPAVRLVARLGLADECMPRRHPTEWVDHHPPVVGDDPERAEHES